MRKMRLIMSLFAMMAAAAFITSCNKDSNVIPESQNPTRFYNNHDCNTECLGPETGNSFQYCETITVGPNESKTVEMCVHNTATHIVFNFVSSVQTGVIQLNGVPYTTGGYEAGEVYTIEIPLGNGWGACADFPYEATVNGGGNPATFTGVYSLFASCDNPCEYRTETGFGGSTKGGGPAWWFIFDTEGSNTQPIYAGQKLTDGSVHWDGTSLHIDLGSWDLQFGNETVKVQGYNSIPNRRPAAGQFTTYKGTSLTVPGNDSRYYVIHLDLRICE